MITKKSDKSNYYFIRMFLNLFFWNHSVLTSSMKCSTCKLKWTSQSGFLKVVFMTLDQAMNLQSNILYFVDSEANLVLKYILKGVDLTSEKFRFSGPRS